MDQQQNGPELVQVVDDDPAIRDSLEWLLYSRGVSSQLWPSGEAFIEGWTPELKGCILLDIRMNEMSGLEVFNWLLARKAPQPVVFLTGHGDLPLAVEALKRGAADFIEKPFNDNDLVDRVLSAIRKGEARLDRYRREQERETRLATLSAREVDVLQKVLLGLLNKQIADELTISMRTVEVHRARVLEKMGVRNVVELARLFGPEDGQGG